MDVYTAIDSSVAEADDVLQGTCQELLELPVRRRLRISHDQSQDIGGNPDKVISRRVDSCRSDDLSWATEASLRVRLSSALHLNILIVPVEAIEPSAGVFESC